MIDVHSNRPEAVQADASFRAGLNVIGVYWRMAPMVGSGSAKRSILYSGSATGIRNRNRCDKEFIFVAYMEKQIHDS